MCSASPGEVGVRDTEYEVRHFKVNEKDLIFDDLPIVEYLTFMSIMKDADIQLFV